MLMVALAFGGCSRRVTPAGTQATAVTGERLHVRLRAIPDLRPVSGEVTTANRVDAVARIGGILASLSVHAGDGVRKGQRIATIVDSRLPYEASAYGAQAAAAQAQAAQASADLSRVQFLYDNGVYARARLDQAQAAARAAQGQVAAAHAQQASVNAIAGQGAIIAPADGRVLTADIPAGSAVMPGTIIATVTAGPPVLRIEVPDSLAGRLHIGAAVIAAGLADGAVAAPRGRITRLYPSVQGGQMRADATIAGLDTSLVGRRVPALLDVGTRPAIIVPRRFVATSFGMDRVTILTHDGLASAVPVQIAPTADPAVVEILSGVSAGDTLVAPARPQ